MGTSVERGTTMADELTVKAVGYGMEHACLEGMAGTSETTRATFVATP